MVGKPAAPTAAPGGSAAADACVAGAGVVVAGAAPDASVPPVDDELFAEPSPAVVAALAAGVAAAGAGPWPPEADTFNERKSIRAPPAAACSW
jgi:hypothetical protein